MKEDKFVLMTVLASFGVVTMVFAVTLWLVNNKTVPKLKLSEDRQSRIVVVLPAEVERV